MRVRDVIVKLLDCPMDAEVTVDTDDSMQGNYQRITHIKLGVNGMGEPFVVLDADWGK